PDPSRFRGWEISDFQIRGAPKDLRGDLKDGLELAGKSKILWTDYPIFTPEKLADDLDRTRLFLARNGYPGSKVEPRLHPGEKEKKLAVTIQVDAGPAVRVADNVTEAFPEELEPKAKKILELKEGEIFTEDEVNRRLAELTQVLKEAGHAFGEITTRLDWQDPTHVVVVFVVDAGPVFTFGSTEVIGVGDDLKEVAKRAIAIEEGATYSPKALDRAEQNLRLLDLFRKIHIYTEAAQERRLHVVADLDERPYRTIEASIGYWTEDQVRASASWKHRNLFRAGRGLSLDGSYSQFLQDASVSVWRPTLFRSRTYGSITLRGQREDEETYVLNTGEVELAAFYLYSVTSTLRGAVALSSYTLDAKTDSAAAFANPGPSLGTFSLTWSQEDLDNRLSPHDGRYLSAPLELGMPGFETTENYARLEPQGILYTPVTETWTLASRALIGYAAPMRNATALLPNKRFYAGGTSSMRGYERRMLGPLDSEGTPIGGTVKAEFSTELRFPIWWRFGGALFVDGGQVWLRRDKVRPRDLRFAVGPGIMVQTPIGPIRVDVGFPLGGLRSGQPHAVPHLSIGHVF
ncbi:MAG: BamA/TamA family outer membrane protein, partial [Candidatus Eisenbacteria bacterium]|nr:BamA/TamA family outer membrane protein [Candidatus Eisenbacteria bacterium]